MKKTIQVIVLFNLMFWATSLLSNTAQAQDTTFNYIDANGMKQGFWKKQYKDTKTIAYRGFFKNNKLEGEYRRYYPSGIKMMEINYDQNQSGMATLYYDDGVKSAEGQYINTKVRNGLWKFYGVDSKLVSEIYYTNGVPNGKEVNYWRNGNVLEEKNWDMGVQTGGWYRYFENGKEQLKARIVNGKRDGLYYVYYPNGQYYIKGHYTQNVRTGHWTYFKEDGTIRRDTEYTNGVAADQDSVDEATTRQIKRWEEMKGQIPDPSIENMLEYTKKYQPVSDENLLNK